MDGWAWLAMGSGILLVLAALLDVFLAVLHIDSGGLMAERLHRILWRGTVFLSRYFPRARRHLLALAGPTMIVASFLVWFGLFILGFALIIWPHLEGNFRWDEEHETLTFLQALYFSGGTGSVLGYGDIVPVTPTFQMVAVVEASLGFALITGIVAYLLNVVSGVAERSAMAVKVYSETEQTGDGVRFVIRSLSYGGLPDLRRRLETLTDALQELQEKMHQFPILDLFYRSREPARDPEPMLQALVQIAIAGQILARDERARNLRPLAEDLGRTVVQAMHNIAKQYLGQEVQNRLQQPEPEAKDRAAVEAIRTRLREGLADRFAADEVSEQEPILTLAFQSRVFLTALDRLTGWRLDHAPQGLPQNENPG